MAVLGMRGTGSFAAAEVPDNYRQAILLLNPNGDSPLTCILSKLKEQATDSPQFFWYEKGLPVQRARIVGAATATGSIPASAADIAANDANEYIALRVTPDGGSANDTSIFKAGHLVHNQIGNEVYRIIKKATDGATNYLIVQRNVGSKYTLGTDTPAVTGDTTTGDTIVICGSSFPEGSELGAAVAYQPVKHYNYTFIHRTPLFLTRTAKKTRLRWDATGPYQEAKREALQLHGIELEKNFFFSERSEGTALTNADSPLDGTSSSQPIRTTRGVLNWLPTISTTSVTAHTDIATLSSGGLSEAQMDSWCEEVFRHGSSERFLAAGSTFINVLNQMVKNKSELQLVPTDQTYGMNFRRWLSPFGTFLIYNHPLLSHDPVYRKDAYALDMSYLSYRYITDTTFLTNRQNPGTDASKDEFLTEAGLEMHGSGATPDSSDGLPSTPAPAVHGRLAGVSTYAG